MADQPMDGDGGRRRSFLWVGIGLAAVLAVVGTTEAVRKHQESSAADRSRPLAAARPAAAETCSVLMVWHTSVTEAAGRYGSMSPSRKLEEDRDAIVRMIADVEKADEQVVQRLGEIRADHQAVPGVAELLGIVETQMSGAGRVVPELKAQAEALPMDNAESYSRARDHIAAGFRTIDASIGDWHMPDARRLETASALAAFQEEPACAGIFF